MLQHLPAHMLTYNMHILVCRLAKQEIARGCTGKDGELWVERGMQRCKSNVKYRVTSIPEKLMMHDEMVDAALLRTRQLDRLATDPQLAVLTFDELIPEYRHNIRAGPLYDTGDCGTHTQLLGKGKPMAGAVRVTAEQQLAVFFGRMPQLEWAGATATPAILQLAMFSMAHKCGDEVLWAKSNARSCTRCACLNIYLPAVEPCRCSRVVKMQAGRLLCLCGTGHGHVYAISPAPCFGEFGPVHTLSR